VGWILLGGLGALAIAAQTALVLTSPWEGEAHLFLVLIASSAAVAGVTAITARRLPGSRGAALWILAVALATHAVWLSEPPRLSDDVYRYAFEGKLLRSGYSPYDHAPLDDAVAHLRDEKIWPHIGHKELSSVYPPLSLVAFAVADIWGGVDGQRLLFGGASLLTVLLLMIALRQSGQPISRAAAYGWAPLPAIEFAGSGHHDSLGILLLIAAVGWTAAGRQGRGAVSWALATGVKVLPAISLPAFWRHWGWGQRHLALIAATAVTLPLVLLSRADHSGLWAYAQRWRHNDLAFTYLLNLFPDGDTARLVSLAAVGVVALGLGLARLPLAAAVLGSLLAALFFSPTLHPWYAGWALALSPLVPSAGAWLLGQTVLITYALPGVQSTPGFAPVPPGWRAIEWGLPLALMAFELRRWWAGRSAPNEAGEPDTTVP
jgi:hypothetical protein